VFVTLLIYSGYALKRRFHSLTKPAAKGNLSGFLLTAFSIGLLLAAPSKHWTRYLEEVTTSSLELWSAGLLHRRHMLQRVMVANLACMQEHIRAQYIFAVDELQSITLSSLLQTSPPTWHKDS